MPNITPCLWFDGQAEEAAKLYTGIFPNAKITATTHYPDVGQETHGRAAGSVMTVTFELDGKPFVALNGGPLFTFSEAVSFMIECKDQKEIDYYWDALTADGGQESQCGWLKDKFGVSWQVTPKDWEKLMQFNGDAEKAKRAMAAMMEMKKLVIADLENA